MAELLAILEKIVKLALTIKEAVDTVRRNKEECQQIRTRAVRVSSLLSRLPETGMAADPAMCGALEDLEDSLRRAHALVAACQEGTTVCLYCTAGRQARRLRRVQDDISQKVMLVVFATNIQTTIILTNIRNGEGEAPPPPVLAMGMVPLDLVGDVVQLCLKREHTSSDSIMGEAGLMLSNNSQRPHDMVMRRHDFIVDSAAGGSQKPHGSGVGGAVLPHPTDEPATVLLRRQRPQGRRVGGAVLPLPDLLRRPRRQESRMQMPPYLTLVASNAGLRKFRLSELEAATDHFSVENMIGSGAFATIYKGVLHDGLVVAIKKFRNPYDLSVERIHELQCNPYSLSKFEHKNIVEPIGYGFGVLEMAEQFGDPKFGAREASIFFVEEYMPNGSLDKIIYGLQLDWSTRFLVIQGVALGLSYLHKRNVAHFDIKPSNIVLDSDMNAKITDFGISRILNRKGVGTHTIQGTLGYMPPEYVTDGILSNKHDVYGFGVTVLEVINGMSRFKRATGQASVAWGWEARQSGRMAELLDTSVLDARQLKEMERCLEVGLLCTQYDPADRPDMLEAIEMLRGERALGTPVRPGYTTKDEQPNINWFRGWSCLRAE